MTYRISPENTPLSAHTFSLIIHLQKDIDDIGFYEVTDALVTPENLTCNFTYTLEGMTLTVFNASSRYELAALKDANYLLHWGDGSSVNLGIEQTASHTYAATGATMVTLSFNTPFSSQINKTILVGGGAAIDNPLGTITIDLPYMTAPFEQDYIGDYDALSQDLVQEDVIISGFTQSRITELIKYGQKAVGEGLDASGNGVYPSGITSNYTAYTIDDIFYMLLPDGLTFYSLNVGLNPLQLAHDMVTKQEALIGVVSDIEVESDLYVERGKVAVFENNLRLTEISSTGELDVYGNGYFTVHKTV